MHIITHPVYSKLADPAEVAQEQALSKVLPARLDLSQHQLETYRSLRNPDIDVVINTAMTGDGKSLAGLLPLLVDRHEQIILYPTKELIEDQHASATNTLPRWKHPKRWVTTLYGERLDQRMLELETAGRGNAMSNLLEHNKLVLSNPDILHYILQFCYQQRGRAPDWIASKMGDNFRQLTFDEFHIFDLPQVVAVLTGLLFLAEQTAGRMKTLFLSATPGKHLWPLLKSAGLRTHLVDLTGCYHHGSNPGAGWRPILQECDIQFATQRVEEWVENHLEDTLLAFFRQYRPGAKGAMIVNSVAAAHRLEQKLKPLFEREGLTVMTNTGLTERPERRVSYHADLLIGTSTVDVGVDFQINFLVFESRDAGTFLQRLGRLGRHTSFTRDNVTHHFEAFQAHALVPEFVAERLFEGREQEPALLTADATITRDDLRQAIEAAFPLPAAFDQYIKRWGRFQPAYVIWMLNQATIRDTYADLRKHLQKRYEQTFNITLRQAFQDIKDLKNNAQALLIEEARSFRGGSPFTCGVFGPKGTIPTTYDLFWLLANADMELLETEQFFARADLSTIPRAVVERAKPVAFFRIHDYRAERMDVVVRLPEAIAAWGTEHHHQAKVVQGVKVEVPGAPWLNELNRSLKQRKVVGIIIPGQHPLALRRSLRLSLMFPLHQYEDVYGATGCIAFAREALILDTVLQKRRFGIGASAGAIIL